MQQQKVTVMKQRPLRFQIIYIAPGVGAAYYNNVVLSPVADAHHRHTGAFLFANFHMRRIHTGFLQAFLNQEACVI